MAEIIDDLINPIGINPGSGLTWENVNYTYDVAVGGQPFFLAASQQYPYKRETAPYRRQQIDQTREPGEQTLTGWWLRSQSSFHLGAGVKYQEPVQGDAVPYRFFKSAGVDPWTIGRVKLLRSMTEIITSAENPLVVGGVDSAGVDMALVASGANLWRVIADGTYTSVTWGGTGNILALTQDGANYYVANSTGVYKGALTGVGTGTLLFSWPSAVSSVVLSWVKQRLMAGAGQNIWEIVGTPTTPTYTHPNPSWKWTGIADGPNSIYFSGYCGTSSSIYRLTLDVSGELPTLTNALLAADMPGGERITAIASYIGKFLAIGTNLGVRVGVIATTGDYTDGYVSYGPLSVTTNGYDAVYDRTVSGADVKAFTFDDRFVYATVTNFIDNGDGTFSSGLVRVDLSREVSPGAMAWATDLRTMTTGAVTGTALLGTTDRKIVVGADGVFLEDAQTLVSEGYVQTGLIRYLTLEDKHFKLIKPRIVRPMSGTVELTTVQENGTQATVITINNAVDPTQDITTGQQTPVESLAFKFTLRPGSVTDFVGPVFTGYQLKSLPAVRRTRQLTIPLLNFDFEEDRYNAALGYEGRAADRIVRLETLESSGDTVVIQDFTMNETVQAVIESVQFVRTSPPNRRFKGFGGILYITARTV